MCVVVCEKCVYMWDRGESDLCVCQLCVCSV